MAQEIISAISGLDSLEPPQKLLSPRLSLEKPPFEKFLDMAVKALEDVSQIENQTNQLINQYVVGEANLQEVLLSTAKMNIAVQLAVTTMTSALTSLKEIQQMPV